MIEMLSFLLIMILLVMSFFVWVEIVALKRSYRNKNKNEKEIFKCEDKDFIWILKNKKWIRYNKIKNEWTVMLNPPL